MQVLRAATVEAARLLDRFDELGRLESGKRADLILVGGNPLGDLSALKIVEVVVKGGEVVVDRRASSERN